MCKILVFAPQAVEIAVANGSLAVAGRKRRGVEQARLSHEYGLNLEQVVAVAANTLQGYRHGPALEGVAVDAEAIGTRHGNKQGRLPRTSAKLNAVPYVVGLALKALGQQAVKPCMHGQAVEPRQHAVTGWITVGREQGFIICSHLVRHAEPYLRHAPACACKHVGVNIGRDVQHNVVISLVAFVPVCAPC